MWSAVEAMTGNQLNKSLRSRLGEQIERLRSPVCLDESKIAKKCKNNREAVEKAARNFMTLRKVRLLFLLEPGYASICNRSETSAENSR